MKLEQVSTVSTKELVAFYNKHAEKFGKKQVAKFSDRMTAEIRVKTMIEDLEAEEQLPVSNSLVTACLGLAKFEAPAVEAVEQEAKKEINLTETENWEYENLQNDHYCPHCGIHLSNGVGVHGEDVNGVKIKHEEREFCCLACGGEFGKRVKNTQRATANRTGEVREEMKTSLKLDRTITAYDKEMVQIGTWPNAFRMWKVNPEWMTSAQQDTLTSKLYKAAKRGERVSVVIDGRTFALVNI